MSIDLGKLKAYLERDKEKCFEKKAELLSAARTQLNMELTLMWTRAGYFSVISIGFVALIGSLLNGALSVNDSNDIQLKNITFYALFLLSLLGFCITSFWCLSNIGSKFWYERWEDNVKALESEIYNFEFYTSVSKSWLRLSLSKLSIALSFMFLVIFLLISLCLPMFYKSCFCWSLVIFVIEIIFFILLYWNVKFKPN